MRKRLIIILCSILIGAGIASAQSTTRTITNDDLEKFRQSRLQAERDLMENYAALGFPSPEEMAQQQKENDLARERLAEKLRRDRLAREQVQLEQQYFQSQNAPNYYFVQNSNGSSYYPYRQFGYFYRYPLRFGYPQTGILGGGYFYPNSNPNQGVQINTTPIRINTTGPPRQPVRINPPR